MDRVMKISSNQSGAVTASKNLIDFDIPAGMVYDLSKSYMVINSSIETTDAHTALTNGTGVAAAPQFSGGVGVYDVGLDYSDGTNSNRLFKNKSLIKNVSMFSQKMGMVEDIKRSDVLQYNLDLYRDDLDTQINASYNQVASLFGANANNGIKWSPYRRLSPEGEEASDNLEREIRIGLSEVMNSCKNIWDGNKYGNTRVHAEVSVGNLVAVQNMKKADDIWTATDGVARGAMATAGAGAITQLTTTRTYPNPDEDSPFFVGQKLEIDFTVGGAVKADFVRQIIKIEHNVDKTLTLTLDFTLGTGALTATTVKGVDAASTPLNFDSAELVLYVTNQAPPPQIAFTTYKTEEDNFTGSGNNYNHQYYLESDVQNVFWGARALDKQLGFEEKINSYRIREAGVDKTDRDVTYGSALHLQRLNRAFGNSNMPIRNYTAGILNNGARISHLIGTSGNVALPAFMIAEPTQVTEMPKLLDVNIVANAGFKLITLFKQIVKVM